MITKITLTKAIDCFPQHIRSDGNTQSTAQAYLCDINQFKIFINAKYKNLVYVESLSRNHVMEYIMYLQRQVDTKRFKRATFDRKCDSLIVFSRYLYDMGYKDEDILKTHHYKRVKSRYIKDTGNDFCPYIFSDDEINEIFLDISNSTDKHKYRNLAIFEMLVELGIRRSTLLVSSWEDIDFVDKTIILHHVKDQITTKVKISTNLCNTLQNYQFITNRSSGTIFISSKGTPLSNGAYNDLIKKYLTKIGAYQKGATGHCFRHTFIIKALKQNISPFKIIKYTGHRDVSSLKPYANLIADDLEDVCDAVVIPFPIELLNKAS